VRGEIRAHGVAAFLAHVLGPVPRVELRHLVGEDLDLLGREGPGKEQVAVAVELLELRRCQPHRVILSWPRRAPSG
jgi:hypothetical protein